MERSSEQIRDGGIRTKAKRFDIRVSEPLNRPLRRDEFHKFALEIVSGANKC
jgi:hypothetical protein